MRDWLAGLQGRWKDLLELYGKVAFGTYLVIFIGTLSGFWLAIRYGIDVGSSAAQLGTLGAAYAATKLLQPVRIAATLLLTPMIAYALGQRPAPDA